MRHNIVILALAFAVVVVGLSSAYSTKVSASNHHASCARADLILDTLHDVVVLAVTPLAGQKLTAVQVRGITTFEAAAFARINEARC